MKNFSLSSICWTICFFVSVNAAFGQSASISGKVLDARTSEALPFANVYINHTTIGQATSADGSFKLDDITAGKWDLIVSFIGYNTKSVPITLTSGELRELTIFLTPSDIELQAVQVTAERDDIWRTNLRKFKRVFLGEGHVALGCILLNPYVLSFSELKSGTINVFTASARAPLQILNETLGYKVVYELKEFSSSESFYNIKGNIYFEELESLDETLLKRWADNRANAYETSLRYFLKAIIDDKVAESGFAIYREKVQGNDILRPTTFMNVLDFSLFPFEREKYVTKNDSTKMYTLALGEIALKCITSAREPEERIKTSIFQ